jgi:hypothetical protein
MTSIYFDKSEMRGIESARKSIQQALDQLKVIRETTTMGTIPNGVFDPLIIRRVQIINPLRVIPIIPTLEVT